jgi:hypothetical protein
MILDIFNNDAFGVVSLTDAVNKMPFVPGRVGQLGLFANRGVATTAVSIEEKNGVLYLVPTSQRGSAGKQNETDKRKMRSLKVPHLQANDTVMADEVQGVRAFGSDSELQTVQMVVNQRLETMTQSLDATLEHLRLGAIKGQILDSDGSTVIYDLFTEFGVSQESEIDFDLDNASPADGVVRKKCGAVIRLMATNLGAAPLTRVHCLCGDAFFDDLVAHPEVRATYLNQAEAAELRGGYVYQSLNFGGITFENYRGAIGSTAFIDTNKAHFFPVGVPGLFVNYFAPADYAETVNTIGLPRYAKQAPDARFNKFVDLEVQANPLPICTRPKALIKGKRT